MIIGECVTEVMECDMIVLDWGFSRSKSCMLARYIGIRYRKIVRYAEEFGINKEMQF